MTHAPISLWDRSAQEPEPPCGSGLDGEARAELAVIGGGFTGLSTALHAAEAGQDAIVLEADRIGHGGSGRNAGLVNAGLWLAPQDVRAKLGEARGAGLLRVLGEAPDDVFSLIERHQMRCEATRAGTIHAAHSAKGLADLRRRAEEWRRLGAPVELLSREEAGARVGSRAFHGGLLDHRAGTINPMGYARGLARAALGAGARILTGAGVERLERRGDRWRLTTARGAVSARVVVLATNAYSGDLWPGLSRAFVPIHYFQLATEPLGARADAILPGREGLWDTGTIMTSLRRDASGRIVVGSMGTVLGGATGLSRRWAARRLARLFPDLGPVAFEAAWHGRIAMTPDHLPRIHRLAEGLYTPIGYNGRGIAPGTVFGRAMAALASGAREADLPLPVSELRPAPRRALMARLHQAVFTANQLVRSV